jgi:very-short-patch-repair endonuclease
MMNKPKVYLARKMDGSGWTDQRDGHKRDWRYPIVGHNLFVEQLWQGYHYELESFYYHGPFYKIDFSTNKFTEKNTHAAGETNLFGERQTLLCCQNGIENADIIFVWLNTAEAHGTIAEIAYACGIKKGKNVTVVVPQCDCDTDDWGGHRSILHNCISKELWFVQELVRAHRGNVIYSNEPVEEFYKVIARWNRSNQKFNSVPEKLFWTEVLNNPCQGLLFNRLVSQHPVGKYRIDFAIPELKFGIEIDGLAYHNGQDSFMKDRSRQREIESQGLRIVRFAAKEISLDVNKCFWEAESIAEEMTKALVGAK